VSAFAREITIIYPLELDVVLAEVKTAFDVDISRTEAPCKLSLADCKVEGFMTSSKVIERVDACISKSNDSIRGDFVFGTTDAARRAEATGITSRELPLISVMTSATQVSQVFKAVLPIEGFDFSTMLVVFERTTSMLKTPSSVGKESASRETVTASEDCVA
jgi:hypothetical protein